MTKGIYSSVLKTLGMSCPSINLPLHNFICISHFQQQSQTSSQISTWSTEDAIPKERLNQFISYLSNGNISPPLETQCTKPSDECTDKTKNYYNRKAEEILHLVAEGIAPGQGNLFAEEILSKEDKEIDRTNIENTIVQLYKEASNSLVKTQLLSIIAKK